MSIFHLPLSILHLLGFAAMSLVCGLLVWPQLIAVWPIIREEIERFRRLPPVAKVVALLFVGAFVVFGGGKNASTNNGEAASSPLVLNGGFRFLTSGEDAASPLTVTEEDIARGWRLWEVKTNAAVSYAMPEGAALATNWWVRGAYEDVTRIELNPAETIQHQAPGTMHQPWRFSFGTNEYDSAWAFSWGKTRFVLADTNTEIVAVGAPMSAVPYRSRLWSAADTNGSRLVTWENFVAGRVLKENVDSFTSGETPLPLCCAQIELRSNGDFITRSNEVETVYRHIDPEDWDDDGWRNDDDPDPYVWEDYADFFWQELPDGANEAAYYWIEIRPKWNSYIEFWGDGPSDLSDPYVYGKAGETYRVQLLIGKTYDVVSDRPFEVVAKSDDRVEVSVLGTNRVEVVWPVEFTVAEGRAPVGRPLLGATWNQGGKSFYVMPNPPWLRGLVLWTDNFCCNVWGDGTNFTYACDNTCTCTGCTVYGNYWYEGYALPVWGIPCGCVSVPDDGPAEIVEFRFTKAAAIYEEPYVNTPGETVTPTPTTSTLRCVVRGGTYGGRLTVSLNANGNAKLRKGPNASLPSGVEIAPGTMRTFEIEYTPIAPSGSEGDIEATAYLDENFLGTTYTCSAELTSVKVELTPRYMAPNNDSAHRHVVGVDEYVDSNCTPSDVTFQWVDEVDVDVDLNETSFWSPWTGGTYHPTVHVQGVPYQTTLDVYEPTVVCMAAWWSGNPGTNGVAGNVEMDLALFVAPSFVSFKDLNIQEIPDDVPHSHWGYFDDQSKGGPWSHTSAAGAGRWHPVLDYGFWTFDAVGVRVYPEPWSYGYKVWDIPVGWGDGSEVKGRMAPNPTRQEFWIDSEGTVTIRKYQHQILRMVNGHVLFDGNWVN